MLDNARPSANFRRDYIPLWINLLSGLVLAILFFSGAVGLG